MSGVIAFCVILLAAFGAFRTGKLNFAAAVGGVVIASICYLGGGWKLLACLAAFFLLSVVATKIGSGRKLALGLAENNGGARQAGQVFANGGIAAICALAALFMPQYSRLLFLAAAAAFASATADTLASEIGNAYGSRYYNILSFGKGTRGANGVISLEGTLAGFGGSLLPATIAATVPFDPAAFYSIVLAGNVACLLDSVLGGIFENRNMLTNDQVNFANTAFGAGLAVILYSIFG